MADSAVTVADLQVVISYRTKGNPQKQIKNTTNALASVGKESEKAEKSTNKFFASVKRIAGYRLLRTALKAIAQSFREGVNNLVLWDRTISNTSGANKTMSELNAKLLELKNSLGASIMPLLQAVLPIIQSISYAIIGVVNLINQFVRAMQGYGTYIKANTVSNYDYSKSLGAVKKQLLGFDELNVLTDNGAANGGVDYKDMFKEVEMAGVMKNHLNEILMLVELVGAGIAGWKIVDKFNVPLTQTIGLMTSIVGVANLFGAVLDEIDNGVSFENLKAAFESTTLLAVGLGLAMQSLNGIALGLGIGGIAMLVPVLKELVETGTLSVESFDQLRVSIALLSVALAPLTSGWSLLAGAIGIATTLIIQNWDKIKTTFNSVVESIKTKFSELIATIKTKLAELKQSLSNSFVGQLFSGIGGILSSAFTGVKNFFSGGFASGGVPPMGSMFIAGETGDPEFVGNVGGRTSVYNSDQLAGSLASANESVVNAILAATTSILNGMEANRTSVVIGDRDIARANARGNKILGSSLIEG